MFKLDDSEAFESKAKENFDAGKLLVDNKLWHAAASKFYYSLIHLALAKAICNKVPVDCYLKERNGAGDFDVDKSAIHSNVGLIFNIKDRSKDEISGVFKEARSMRNKADYEAYIIKFYEIDVIKRRVEKFILNQGIIV